LRGEERMENKKAQTLGVILMLFIGIIVGLVLVQPIFDEQDSMTQRQTITDEAIDISAARLTSNNINESYEFEVAQAPSGWKSTHCPLTSVTYGNSSEDFTVTTDYIITSATGNFTLVNSTALIDSDNDTLIDYTYCMDGYNVNSSSRTVAGLIGLFAVLGLMAFVLLGIKQWIGK